MIEKISRRTLLQAGTAAALAAAATVRPAGAEHSLQRQVPPRGLLMDVDPYETLFRRHGGELGGRKPPVS